jgi:DNA-directed RNA polymerase subunit RPC12/RpoP
MPQVRHVDKGVLLGTFANHAAVVCPNCEGPALVTCNSLYALPFIPTGSKVTCMQCGFHKIGGEGIWLGPTVGVAKRRCPNCGFKWLLARIQQTSIRNRVQKWKGIRCPECETVTRVPVEWRVRRIGVQSDPAFGLPLWLKTSCCGEPLWAYNAEHLRALRAYVAAGVRERVGMLHWSMFSRLPKWISAKKNRDAVLAGIDRLEVKLATIQEPFSPPASRSSTAGI